MPTIEWLNRTTKTPPPQAVPASMDDVRVAVQDAYPYLESASWPTTAQAMLAQVMDTPLRIIPALTQMRQSAALHRVLEGLLAQGARWDIANASGILPLSSACSRGPLCEAHIASAIQLGAHPTMQAVVMAMATGSVRVPYLLLERMSPGDLDVSMIDWKQGPMRSALTMTSRKLIRTEHGRSMLTEAMLQAQSCGPEAKAWALAMNCEWRR